MKIPKQYYIWLAVGFVLLSVFEFYKKKDLDWRLSLSTYDEIPYGTKVNYQLLQKGKWEGKIKHLHQSFYEYSKTDSSDYALVFMNGYMNLDKESINSLLQHVERGHVAMLCATSFPYALLDTLGISVNSKMAYDEDKRYELGDIIYTDTLYNAVESKYYSYFDWNDSIQNVSILGTFNDMPNLIEVNHGEGKLLMHISPKLFTNYYLVHQSVFPYVNKVFSYLPDTELIWDDYLNNGSRKPNSELRYVLSSIPIRTAYYLLTIVAIIFMVFVWRRRQKVIPVLQAPQNASVGFMYTLTNLFLSNKNNGIIGRYLVRNFKYQMTRKYLINWNKPEANIAEQLKVKLNQSDEEVDKLLKLLNKSDNDNNLSQNRLIEINKVIEKFIK